MFNSMTQPMYCKGDINLIVASGKSISIIVNGSLIICNNFQPCLLLFNSLLTSFKMRVSSSVLRNKETGELNAFFMCVSSQVVRFLTFMGLTS